MSISKTAKPLLVFDKSIATKKLILDSLGKATDREGYIIEKESKQRVLTKDGEEIHIKIFGGILKGSEIFIKDDIFSVMELSDHIKG